MVVLTAACVLGFDDSWTPLFILAAIGIGVTNQSRWALPAVVTLTLVAGGSAWVSTGRWDAAWTTALPTFLAGASTYWFCLLVAVITELARTRQELADTAVTQERLRFSRDLHDLLGHTLSVIVVKAEVVRRLTRSDEAAEHAADIETIGRRALAEVRQAASSFRGMTFAGELGRARIALQAAGIDLASPDQPPSLPAPVDELFGWVVREAVTNVVRHSGAARCTITVAVRGDDAVIDVSDDGSTGHGATPGGGLIGLRERAEAVHGRLDVTGSADGLTLSVHAPVAELVGRR
jgi:two-component system sensor histidine kinase DesK